MAAPDANVEVPPASVPQEMAALLAAARRQGVSCADNLPFYLQAPGDAAVLLVHGFSASPWEMRALGEYLVGAGFTVLGVRLPGHGTTPEDLAGTSHRQWSQAVADGFALLRAQSKRVYGVGQSAGALLLINQEWQLPLAGLVLFSPFLRLRHPLAPLAGFFRFLKSYQRRPIDPHLAPYYYNRRPLAAVAQLNAVLRRARRSLPQVVLPVLLLSAAGDRTAVPDSAIELFRRLRGYPRHFYLFGPDVPHVLTTSENPRQKEVFALTLEFLRHLEGRGPV